MAFNQYPKIKLKHLDTFEYESVNESGNTVKIDMYDPENKKGQSPTELLLTALASCSAVDVVEILNKRRKTFTDFSIEAKGHRREEHPRYFERIDLIFSLKSDNITEEELLKQAKMVVEKYCSVASNVNSVSEINILAKISS
ncbi:MAG: OsmC family protein [Cyclobacteriaceae bacterium]|nr:OsmC family protein [Cyclobacteriaceae bacterium]